MTVDWSLDRAATVFFTKACTLSMSTPLSQLTSPGTCGEDQAGSVRKRTRPSRRFFMDALVSKKMGLLGRGYHGAYRDGLTAVSVSGRRTTPGCGRCGRGRRLVWRSGGLRVRRLPG